MLSAPDRLRLTGASSVAQLEQNAAALGHLDFAADELGEIELHALDSAINIWPPSSDSSAIA